MGMDIHTVLQVRTAGRWESIDPPADMVDEYGDPPWELRNYSWFGLLAGMRDRCVDEPIAEARGIPADAGAEWTGGGWGDPAIATIDGRRLGEYGYSWVGLPELQAVDLTAPYSGRYGAGFSLGDQVRLDWTARLAELADDPSDVRLVFGFDG